MTERRYRAVFVVMVCYCVAATIANAIAYVSGIDARALAFRTFDFAWELGLPWRAAHGQWVGRDFSYPIGPLWQLLALAGALGHAGKLGPTLGGIHVVFPLLSFGVCVAIAVRTFPDWKRRAMTFGLLALLAGYDDAKSLRAVASLALIVAYVPQRDDDGDTNRSWRRALLVGGVSAGLTLLSFDVGILGLASLAFAAAFEARATGRAAVAGLRFARALAGIGVGMAALALGWALAGGSLLSALAGWFQISRTYAYAMVQAPAGLRLAPLVAFAISSVVLLAWVVKQTRDRTASMWLGAALPLVGRAVVRSDAEHIYAGLMPLVAALALVGLRFMPDQRGDPSLDGPKPKKSVVVSAWALLLFSSFSFAWFGSHREFPIAWRPSGFLDAARALAHGAKKDDEADITHVRHWVEAKVADEGIRCVGLPERDSVVHPLADIAGPTATMLRWSPAMSEELASRIARQKCPYFVRDIVSYDFGPPFQNHAFGPDFLAISRWYRPAERIGPSIFAAKLRDQPVSLAEEALSVSGLGRARQLSIPARLEYRLPRAVSPDDLLLIDYTLDVPWTSKLIGRLPWIHVRLADDAGTIGAEMALNDVSVGERTRVVVPVQPEIAEWRWVAGFEFAHPRPATRLLFDFEKPALAPSRLTFALDAVAVVAPPDPPRSPKAVPETRKLDLLDAIAHGAHYARGTAARVSGDSLLLPPNEPNTVLAEVFVPIHPVHGSCLFAELGVEGTKGDGVWFEIHVVDGVDRPRLLRWHNLPGVSPRPAELPLERWAGRDVLLRFGTSPGATTLGDDARVYRPRIGPCAARENLIHAFHDGRIRGIRGNYRVLGDTVVMELPHQYEPPTEIRAPITVESGSCLALDMRAEGPVPGESVAIDAGILEGRVYDRLAREEMDPGVQRRHLDLPLANWEGRSVELRITAWRHAPGTHSRAVVARVRIHRCGDGAPWGFGPGAAR